MPRISLIAGAAVLVTILAGTAGCHRKPAPDARPKSPDLRSKVVRLEKQLWAARAVNDEAAIEAAKLRKRAVALAGAVKRAERRRAGSAAEAEVLNARTVELSDALEAAQAAGRRHEAALAKVAAERDAALARFAEFRKLLRAKLDEAEPADGRRVAARGL